MRTQHGLADDEHIDNTLAIVKEKTDDAAAAKATAEKSKKAEEEAKLAAEAERQLLQQEQQLSQQHSYRAVLAAEEAGVAERQLQ